jgi:hypothetical protein
MLLPVTTDAACHPAKAPFLLGIVVASQMRVPSMLRKALFVGHASVYHAHRLYKNAGKATEESAKLSGSEFAK